MFAVFSWGLVMLTYKLFRLGHVAIGIAAIRFHLLVCALVIWLSSRAGELRRRVKRDHLAAVLLAIWLIGTWIVGLKL
jgi:hypothetical protein